MNAKLISLGITVAGILLLVFFVRSYFTHEVNTGVTTQVNAIKEASNTQAVHDLKQDVKAGDKAVVESVIAVQDHRAQSATGLQVRESKEAVIVKRHEASMAAHQTAEPLTATPTSTDNAVSEVRIDWLLSKYCDTKQQGSASCATP